MTVPSVTPSQVRSCAAAARGNRAARSAARGRLCHRPSAVCRQHGGRADRARSRRRGCRARMCRSSSMMPAKASLPQATDRLAALGYTNVRQLDGGLAGLADGGLRNVPGRQFLRQGVRRTGRVAPPHALAARGRGRRADREQGQHRHSRCPAVRRICDHEHPGLASACPARNWCCAPAAPRRIPTRPSSSIAPAAPVRSSAPSR